MRKKWIKISQNNSRIHGNALIASSQEIAPGWEVRCVCTFHLLIRVHYIVVNHIVKYLLSVCSI